MKADFLVNLYDDKADEEGILQIREKYFRTSIGKQILNDMFDLEN